MPNPQARRDTAGQVSSGRRSPNYMHMHMHDMHHCKRRAKASGSPRAWRDMPRPRRPPQPLIKSAALHPWRFREGAKAVGTLHEGHFEQGGKSLSLAPFDEDKLVVFPTLCVCVCPSPFSPVPGNRALYVVRRTRPLTDARSATW